MGTQQDELLRLADAKRKKAEPRRGENGIEDGPNPVLDEHAVRIAQELADKYGLEKLQKFFPDMAALLDDVEQEESDG
jgi:hypothetical protein